MIDDDDNESSIHKAKRQKITQDSETEDELVSSDNNGSEDEDYSVEEDTTANDIGIQDGDDPEEEDARPNATSQTVSQTTVAPSGLLDSYGAALRDFKWPYPNQNWLAAMPDNGIPFLRSMIASIESSESSLKDFESMNSPHRSASGTGR